MKPLFSLAPSVALQRSRFGDGATETLYRHCRECCVLARTSVSEQLDLLDLILRWHGKPPIVTPR
jgi:hypothetical protein